jgi:phytanoyl-CoA hydroxylase
MRVSAEEIETFETKGYLVLRGFADAERCDTIRDIAEAHLRHRVPPIETEREYAGKSKEERERISDGEAQERESQLTVRRLRQVYHRDIVFREWMEDEAIRPILTQLLGEDPVITIAHHNSIMTKMPHSSTQTAWHQDIRYWRFERDDLVSVWLALGEENEENGVLEFIPGSHRMHFVPEQFDDKEYFIEESPLNEALVRSKEWTTLHKGDVVFFHSKLLHRANPNCSERPKISFVYTVHGISNHPLPGTRSSSFPEIVLS